MIEWIKKLLFKKKTELEIEGINIVDSISKAKPLYKELVKIAHPDKHPDKVDYYKELTERINANRYNYNELVKIKKELLGINHNSGNKEE